MSVNIKGTISKCEKCEYYRQHPHFSLALETSENYVEDSKPFNDFITSLNIGWETPAKLMVTSGLHANYCALPGKIEFDISIK